MKLLKTRGLTTRSKDATIGAPGIATRSILTANDLYPPNSLHRRLLGRVVPLGARDVPIQSGPLSCCFDQQELFHHGTS